jgi:hypothetical protein
MDLAEHLETHLGKIRRGWSSKSAPGIQVCSFADCPTVDLTTLSTLGLSDTILQLAGERRVRQELVMVVGADVAADDIVRLLLHMGSEVQERGSALLRGEVFPLEGPVSADSGARALYASMPVVFPEGIETFSGTSPPTVIVWLFPILPPEVQLVEEVGWSEFEERLQATNPALFDYRRLSVV